MHWSTRKHRRHASTLVLLNRIDVRELVRTEDVERGDVVEFGRYNGNVSKVESLGDEVI